MKKLFLLTLTAICCISSFTVLTAGVEQSRCAVEIEVERNPNTPSIILTANAKGTAPFKYEWSNGETTEKIRVDKRGRYCVTITDRVGCQSRACEIVGDPNRCAVEIVAKKINDSTYTLEANGKGTAPFQYRWTNGETTKLIRVNETGQYCVGMEDSTGCQARACITIRIGSPNRCAVRIQQQRNVDGSVNLIAHAVGQAPFKYEWSTGETTARIQVKMEGEYCVKITDSAGCESRTCTKVRMPNNNRCKVAIRVVSRDSNGVFVLKAVAGGTAPYKYEWSNGETTEQIKVDSNGQYCVAITDSTGCEARACIKIGANTNRCKVIIKARKNRVDSTVTLGAYIKGGTAPYKYEWSNGETTKTITIDKPGKYCVTVTSSNGCVARACYELRGNKVHRDSCFVRILERKDRAGNVYLAAIVKGTAPFKYEWSNGETTEAIKVDKSGTYCVTITDRTGCQARTCIDVKLLGAGPTSLKAFPNPMDDVLYVTWEYDQKLETDYLIADPRGNVMLKGTWTNDGDAKNRIDVSNLRPGIYTLTLKTSFGVKSIRLTKQ